MGYRLYIRDKNKSESFRVGKLYTYVDLNGKSPAIEYLSEHSPEMKEEYKNDNYARYFDSVYEYAYDVIHLGVSTSEYTLTKDECTEFMKLYLNDFKRGYGKEYDKQTLSDIRNYINEADTLTISWF